MEKSGRPAGPPRRITAGVGILLIAVLAGFGKFVAVDGLVTPGDAARTATAIMASEGLFRIGVVALSVVVALDIVVAWALYRVFSPVNVGISLLAAWFRIVYAGVFLVATSQLVGVLRLLGGDDYLAAFNTGQLQAQALSAIHAFGDVFRCWTSAVRPAPAHRRLPDISNRSIFRGFWVSCWPWPASGM